LFDQFFLIFWTEGVHIFCIFHLFKIKPHFASIKKKRVDNMYTMDVLDALFDVLDASNLFKVCKVI
jgi:hypothetical protein